MDRIAELLNKEEFPRASTYDYTWAVKHQMGPNALWLTEWLTEEISLQPGMRVLDLGCGKGISSAFLAKEFGVQVWAADLWISPETILGRAAETDTLDLVHPLKAEAHALPFPEGFFDAALSVDAYQYFGTDVLYLGYLARFVKQNGRIGIAVPGLMEPICDVPQHLCIPQSSGKVFWEEECWCFKTAQWWREHWSRSSSVVNVQADTLQDGWKHWRDFEMAVEASGHALFPSDAEALEKDQGRYLGFIRVTASRSQFTAEDLYNPSLGKEAGVE